MSKRHLDWCDALTDILYMLCKLDSCAACSFGSWPHKVVVCEYYCCMEISTVYMHYYSQLYIFASVVVTAAATCAIAAAVMASQVGAHKV